MKYNNCSHSVQYFMLFNILFCSCISTEKSNYFSIFLSKCILCHLYVSAISVTFMIWIFTFPSYLDAIIITITLYCPIVSCTILSCLALPCYIFHFIFLFYSFAFFVFRDTYAPFIRIAPIFLRPYVIFDL